MFKKIYIEITNNCNLNCSFCTHNKRPNKFMSLDEFSIILDKIKGYTEHIYLHVLGEPLLHPNIIEFINLASKYYKINITTNGYLLDRLNDLSNVRQINISLHSYNNNNSLFLEDYLHDIFKISKKLSRNTYINYRLWIKDEKTEEIIKYINKEYHTEIDYQNISRNTTLAPNIFLSTHKEFIWPKITEDKKETKGTCYALKDHIAILVDGTVIPCCLDADGIIDLGNIFSDDLENIIKSNRYQQMLQGFKENKKCEKLCQNCNFIEK